MTILKRSLRKSNKGVDVISMAGAMTTLPDVDSSIDESILNRGMY